VPLGRPRLLARRLDGVLVRRRVDHVRDPGVPEGLDVCTVMALLLTRFRPGGKYGVARRGLGVVVMEDVRIKVVLGVVDPSCADCGRASMSIRVCRCPRVGC
jgi:hypothetical protein